ncbi:hypothetical protein ACIGXA_10455 [Streptomyces fildesensis]|uniref:Secreted protein n=1 Tax=Streptomyces fildesensis TaxID=375757 RepID=A0ABW8C3E4_9ACTN
MSRRWKIAIIVLTAGIAALVLVLLYGPSWFLAWADDPGKQGTGVGALQYSSDVQQPCRPSGRP